MPATFNVDAARSTFQLPLLTREQIAALMSDLNTDARSIIIMAVAQLWQREIGEPDRDVLAELDELRSRISKLES